MTGDGHRWPRVTYVEVDSTMDEARRVVRTRADDAIWIIARHQRRGRGREGRVWIDAGEAALLATLALRRGGPWDPGDSTPGTIALRVAAVVVHALGSLALGAPIVVKWPNDILVHDRKLCGILTEADGSWFRIGIGLNIRPVAVPGSVSIAELTTGPGTIEPEALVELLEAGCRDLLRGDAWHEIVARRLAWQGEPVRVDSANGSVAGTLRGIAPDGALLIAGTAGDADAVCRIISGTLRRESS